MPQPNPTPRFVGYRRSRWTASGLIRPNAREFYVGLAAVTLLACVAVMRGGPQISSAASPRFSNSNDAHATVPVRSPAAFPLQAPTQTPISSWQPTTPPSVEATPSIPAEPSPSSPYRFRAVETLDGKEKTRSN